MNPVRAVALPEAWRSYLEDLDETDHPTCPCGWGRCGACRPPINDHAACLDRPGRELVEEPATYLEAFTPGRVAAVAVYEAGHRHRWICPCARTCQTPTDLLDLLRLA